MDHSLLTVRVATKKEEALGVSSFELIAPDGGSLPPFSAGAHIDVYGPTGIVRQYSLCNHPSERTRYLIAVLRDPKSRGGSAAMHDQVQVGDIIRISAPRNLFPLAQGARRSLLLAGGIGVTPILCMAEHLSDGDAAFEMHYFARSRERTAFQARIAQAAFRKSVAFHFDDEPSGQKQDIATLLASQDEDTHLYVCGPGGFLDAVLNAARAQQWPAEHIHYEYFGATAKTGQNLPFSVRIASSGAIYAIAADKSVVAALSVQGVEIAVSCEQGICGTCLTRVLAGEPDHRDQFLSNEERAANNQFLPCCSRARSPMLVLDL
ncbi:MAG: PDR/VanB family oxidoreductase [Pseudomonadota bacterium]